MLFRSLLILSLIAALILLAGCRPAQPPVETQTGGPAQGSAPALPAAEDLRGQGCQPGTAGGKTGVPVRVCLEFLSAPLLHQTVTLRVTVLSLTDADLTNGVIRFILPEQVRMARGVAEWKGILAAKGEETQEVEVTVVQAGQMRVRAEFSSFNAEGYGFSAADELYLDVSEAGVKVSQQAPP